MKVKAESEKVVLKLNIQKLRLWHLVPSVQFSCSVMSNSLHPRGLQHTRPPCPSPAPGVQPNSSPLSRWCHPTISSSVVPFSSCLQSFLASGSFQTSQLFASGGQSIGLSASTSVLPMKSMAVLKWWAGISVTQALCVWIFTCEMRTIIPVSWGCSLA